VFGLNVLQVASFDGTADVDSDIHAPQGDIAKTVTLNMRGPAFRRPAR